MRKTYTYEDELKARRIGAIVGTLYVIAMIIWLMFDGANYDTDIALHVIGEIFGPILAFGLFVAVAIILCFIIDKIKQLFLHIFRKISIQMKFNLL